MFLTCHYHSNPALKKCCMLWTSCQHGSSGFLDHRPGYLYELNSHKGSQDELLIQKGYLPGSQPAPIQDITLSSISFVLALALGLPLISVSQRRINWTKSSHGWFLDNICKLSVDSKVLCKTKGRLDFQWEESQGLVVTYLLAGSGIKELS